MSSEIILRPYQENFYNDVMVAKNKSPKVAAVLATGGGKSVIIAKAARDLDGRTLILTHRIEILEQNSELLNCGILNAKKNTVKLSDKIVVAMVQTLDARIKNYGIDYIGSFDNIILDEIQVLIFEKVFSKYNAKIILGFTATPIVNKKIESEVDGIEFTEPWTFSEMFDDIVCGIGTQELIDMGYLVQDHNIVLNLPDFDKLVESDKQPDGYTVDSLNQLYSNTASLDILEKGYNDYCKGKKTLIFNASTKINVVVRDFFVSKGLNAKLFDTRNVTDTNPATGKPYKRNEIIEWFRNERDAILINTNVFTTGFNVTDVECVIMNRATKSLSLWIQCVGRGSRTTDVIFKPKFTVLDLGQNIYKHGTWSTDRDWKKLFYPQEKQRKRKEDLFSIWVCPKCDAMNVLGTTICEDCGYDKTTKPKSKEKQARDGELVEITKVPLPKSKQIINYCIRKKRDANFAFKLLEKQIVELFIAYNVKQDFYVKNREAFHKRVSDIYRPVYFGIIHSDLTGANKTLNNQIKRILTKIDKLYDVS